MRNVCPSSRCASSYCYRQSTPVPCQLVIKLQRPQSVVVLPQSTPDLQFSNDILPLFPLSNPLLLLYLCSSIGEPLLARIQRSQMLHYRFIGVHEPVHAVIQTALLPRLKLTTADLRCDAFLEACFRDAMDIYIASHTKSAASGSEHELHQKGGAGWGERGNVLLCILDFCD